MALLALAGAILFAGFNNSRADDTATTQPSTQADQSQSQTMTTARAIAGVLAAAALKEAEGILNSSEQDRTNFQIAEIEKDAGNFAVAEAITSEISSELLKTRVIYSIAAAKAQAGDLSGVKAIVAMPDWTGEMQHSQNGGANEFNAMMAHEGSPYWKAMACVEIGKALTKAGDSNGSAAAFDEALSRAAQIPVAGNRPAIYGSIVGAHIESGDIKGARRMLSRVSRFLNKTSQEGLFANLAAAQAKKGDLNGAKTTANQITDDSLKKIAFVNIAAEQAEAGDWNGAKTTISQSQIPGVADAAYVRFAEIQAKSGNLSKAKATAAQIADPKLRMTAYAEIGRILAEAGDCNGAQAIAAQLTDKNVQNEVFFNVAIAQAKAGDIDGAKSTAATTSDPMYPVLLGRSEAGNVDEVIQTIEKTTDDPRARCGLYIRLARMILVSASHT